MVGGEGFEPRPPACQPVAGPRRLPDAQGRSVAARSALASLSRTDCTLTPTRRTSPVRGPIRGGLHLGRGCHSSTGCSIRSQGILVHWLRCDDFVLRSAVARAHAPRSLAATPFSGGRRHRRSDDRGPPAQPRSPGHDSVQRPRGRTRGRPWPGVMVDRGRRRGREVSRREPVLRAPRWTRRTGRSPRSIHARLRHPGTLAP